MVVLEHASEAALDGGGGGAAPGTAKTGAADGGGAERIPAHDTDGRKKQKKKKKKDKDRSKKKKKKKKKGKGKGGGGGHAQIGGGRGATGQASRKARTQVVASYADASANIDWECWDGDPEEVNAMLEGPAGA